MDMIDGFPEATEECSFEPAKSSAIIDMIAAEGVVAQVCAIHCGKIALVRNFGCDDRSLFWTFSISKTYVAALIYILVDRGLVELDDPVAFYWPEFGRHGKEAITIRNILQHRSGISAPVFPFGDLLTFAHWKRAINRVENIKLRWPIGEVPAYLPLAYGFILGELVQRTTGRRVDEFLRSDLLEPLGAHDTYLGVSESEWRRRVPVITSTFGKQPMCAMINSGRWRSAIIPATGISTTARDLARLYFMLLRSGRVDNTRILSEAILKEAVVPSADGVADRTSKLPIRWSNGFQLGGVRAEGISPFGITSSRTTFGHNGSNSCIAWADPDRDLVFVYLTHRLASRKIGAAHLASISDAVLAGCR